ncbi:MAG: hypothetical protein ACE5PM_06270 [Candidatus Hydrothermarchaeales archaeon]
MSLGRFSFFTKREIEIFKLCQRLGSQREVARELGVVDSVVTSALKNLELKTLKLMNTLEECLELGLITREDVLEVLGKFS